MVRRPLPAFFVLTFAIAWGVPGLALLIASGTGAPAPDLSEFTPLLYVSLWAPAAAAVLVIAKAHGAGGVKRYLRRIVRPTGRWGALGAVVYNATRGSVLVAVLYHWMTNLPYPWETGLDLSPVAGPLWILAALIVGGTVGRKYLGRTHQHVDVAPGLFPEDGPSAPESAPLPSSSLPA